MDTERKTSYGERFSHDNCGIGAVISIDGKRSYAVVDDALKIVERLEHRAGRDAEGKVGDGVGIITQLPHTLFRRELPTLGNAGDYAVGMFFFPQDEKERADAHASFERVCAENGVSLITWRKVPIDTTVPAKRALDAAPCIEQCFVRRPDGVDRGAEFERLLFIVRRSFEHIEKNTYVCSLSSRTIVYKGMLLVGELRRFYKDLENTAYESAIAMVHSRFSTNTTPNWRRAHPNRMILHNGEINTIRGNADRMMAREETMHSTVFSDAEMKKILPVIESEGSDSAMLDNTLEFLTMNGVPLPLAVMMTIPEPWKNDSGMKRARRDMYRYYATMMEPWDGPAAVLFTDGELVGAALDRNGLRPARYYLTDDNRLILASEVGVLDIPAGKIVARRRLQPGKMLLADTVHGKLFSDDELKEDFSTRHPYGEWLDSNLIELSGLKIPNKRVPQFTPEERNRMYNNFGYTNEDLSDIILPMAKNGVEATAAMGCDVPLAVLSDKHQPLYNYFKQLFAQVTNPPIDALREKIVTDTTVYVGSDGNLLSDKPENCAVLAINNPILSSVDLMKIRGMDIPGFKVRTVSLLYGTNEKLGDALERLFAECDRAHDEEGVNVIILSDRGVDENHVAIPSLLAVSAMEQHLIRVKKRTAVSIILESAEPRDVHHFAALLGYGARAVNPYLAQESIAAMIDEGVLDKDYHTAIADYNEAVLHGMVKIASKIGISTLQSYQSAQIFEAVGIDEDVIEKYFTNTPSPVGGIGLDEINEDVLWHHNRAYSPEEGDNPPDKVGMHKRSTGKNAEDHLFDPKTIMTLREATREGSYKKFKKYTAMIDDERRPHTLRSLLDFVWDKNGGIPLEDVEPASEIVKRFKTGAMSYGSISGEAHECMAIAMNRLGGRSNSGEGGEDPSRYGTERNSAIKQVASGRFGVTAEYLASADEIQIKLAQGAKPGEGGHLPGKKVYPWIAKTRCSTPGVSLISPPPHHDIYSIEDLAQLIYDLKNVNDRADISVKLVSEAGVGTIAAGVVKAGADIVLISGYDGGTGAAPQSSIHNAGLPWETGLAEAHRTLTENGLREQVHLEVDGKLMSGRDTVIAAILGAEQFGFATAPLVSLGCVMMRVCNLDTCPVGIATQNPKLRAKFIGKPEYVMNFMLFIAEEMREIMARLGVRSVDELVGRTDLIKVREEESPRARKLDLNSVIGGIEQVAFVKKKPTDLSKTADKSTLIPEFLPYIEKDEPHEEYLRVSSTDRTLGASLGSEIVRRRMKPEDDTYTVNCTGGGGQSFGAFLPHGVTLKLRGDANDYFGKGLSGGKLVLAPEKGSMSAPDENIIVGNVALYGATSGKAYICGEAGERFCVRNSGADAVVEGCGDHGCEYMTGGRVAVLGDVGKNFAAGMSGGVAYVLDTKHDLYRKLNKDMVTMSGVTDKKSVNELKELLEAHLRETGSPKAEAILASLDEYLPEFKLIVPRDYKRMRDAIESLMSQGLDKDEAELEAFHTAQRA